MRYTIDQIKTALLLLKTTGSPNKVIELLGYPSNPMLYYWRDKYPEYYDTPIQKYLKQAPLELKRNTIERCTIGGESVKSVAEDIGYSPSLIYKGGGADKNLDSDRGLTTSLPEGKKDIQVRAWNAEEPFFTNDSRNVLIYDQRIYGESGVTDLITNVPERYLM